MNQTLVHFYRAVVGHSDVWRQRMDATTNWAAATTAAMITFTFGADSPHFVLLLALAFDVVFLLMESRRYQVYNLWWRRFVTLNRYIIAPALSERLAPAPEIIEEKLEELALDLGRTTPRLSLVHAAGYRIRRNYGYIFALVVAAWLSKLGTHPRGVTSAGEFVERASIAGLPGAVVLAVIGTFLLLVVVLAAMAPTEHLVNWVATPPTLQHWFRWFRRSPVPVVVETSGEPPSDAGPAPDPERS